MFNIGGGEMFVLGLLALMVFGPQDLPRIIKKVMRTVRALRTAAADFQTEVRTALEHETEQQEQLKNPDKRTLEVGPSPSLETEHSPEPPENEVAAEERSEDLEPGSDEVAESAPDGETFESEATSQEPEAQQPEAEELQTTDETPAEDEQPLEESEPEIVEEDDDGPGLPMAPPKKRAELT